MCNIFYSITFFFNVNKQDIFVAAKTIRVNVVRGVHGVQIAFRKLIGMIILKQRHSMRKAFLMSPVTPMKTARNTPPKARAPTLKTDVSAQKIKDRNAVTKCFELSGCKTSFQMMCMYAWRLCNRASRCTMMGSYSAYLSTFFPQRAQRSRRIPSIFMGALFPCLVASHLEAVLAFMSLKMQLVGQPHSTHTNFPVTMYK